MDCVSPLMYTDSKFNIDLCLLNYGDKEGQFYNKCGIQESLNKAMESFWRRMHNFGMQYWFSTCLKVFDSVDILIWLPIGLKSWYVYGMVKAFKAPLYDQFSFVHTDRILEYSRVHHPVLKLWIHS